MPLIPVPGGHLGLQELDVEAADPVAGFDHRLDLVGVEGLDLEDVGEVVVQPDARLEQRAPGEDPAESAK